MEGKLPSILKVVEFYFLVFAIFSAMIKAL